MLYHFGRAGQVDRAGIERLIASVQRLLGQPTLPTRAATGSGERPAFVGSRPLGGTWALDGLWDRPGIGAAMTKLVGNPEVMPR